MDQIQEFNGILQSFKIKALCVNYKKLDNYFYYDLKISPDIKVKDLYKYTDEISLALKTSCKPSIKIIHRYGIVRLEFIQYRTNKLHLFDIFTNKDRPVGELICLLGEQVDGSKVWMDLSDNPHMIIAGTTGSGKSTLLHNLIGNIMNYNDADLFLIDPKNIEFNYYDNKLRNTRVFYTYDQALQLFNSLIILMENRYAMLRNGIPISKMKHQIVIVDEFADLILQDNANHFYDVVCRLAQKCRAARIHIVLATQRPSVNIIDGTIKANFPVRIACKVASHVDSKVILDATGAENLLGRGDAIIRDNFRSLDRFQVAYTSPQEIVNFFGE